ncbi:MAG TPA: diaminopimelate decarboxylase [Gemmatimonadaceae bacterium]|nr:diaminopimelate decarboxylase [Gemmatimonadaceae bacterium]
MSPHNALGGTVGTALAAAFARSDGALACEGVALKRIADDVGTPAYVYSLGSIRDQFRRLTQAISDAPHRVHYSCKANGNLAILRTLHALGAGVDVVSGGELYRAGLAGFASSDIIFGGVGKTIRELEEAVAAGVLLVNAESEDEIRMLSDVAQRTGKSIGVGLRVNPEVAIEAFHAYTRTGDKGHKFGVPYDEALAVAEMASRLPGVKLAALDMHVGSQLTALAPYRRALDRIVALLSDMRSIGLSTIEYLDIGGGLGVTYSAESPLDVTEYGALVREAATQTGLTILLEPGRFLVGNAGVLLTRVLYRKRSGGRNILVTDAGMNDLLRPSHYQAYHRIEAVELRGAEDALQADVVGPVCESGDFLALDRALPDVQVGDYLAVYSAGAYGFSMASNYNARPRAAEVVVDGDRYAVATERERYEDLARREQHELEWRSE